MMPRIRFAALLAAALVLSAVDAAAQDVERIPDRLLAEVMPEADRFDPAEGDPPVRRAYRGGELIGYVFVTSDLPPQETGYSGSIQALVGMTTEGVLTGVRATQYRESLRFEWDDFLNEPALLAQFVGKRVTDYFSLRQDLDGLSGATISVNAMARDVRDTARRIAITYFPRPEGSATPSEEELVELSWYEMQRRGLAVTMSVRQERRDPFDVSLIHMSDEALGRYLLGDRYDALVDAIEAAGGADEVLLYVVEGGGFVASLRTGWGIEQEGRSVELPRERVLDMGRPEGELRGQSIQAGALLLDDREVDARAPLTVFFHRGRPELGTFRVDYTSHVGRSLAADAGGVPPEAPTREPASTTEPLSPPEPAAPAAEDSSAAARPPDAPTSTVTAPPPETTPPSATAASPDPTLAADPIEPTGAPPADVVDRAPSRSTALTLLDAAGWVILVVALAGLAFFTKAPALRWTSLAATTVLLGWVDGSFLSISHVTGLVWVGFSPIASDPALLIMAVTTVAALLIWGRVFCGYLCPFGALQDLVDRVVPRRFKRELPRAAHRVAWKAKYVILALIVGAAVAGVEVSLYQYFEPFGTVFFLSSSVLLWGIATAFLAASAVIPRFYCRYACPLGALLAIGSLVAVRRIPRVEQCGVCHVCEQKCPTGAIEGAKLSFGECVRCNVCEVQLRERRGVCRHDMEEIRPRLVQIRARAASAAGQPTA